MPVEEGSVAEKTTEQVQAEKVQSKLEERVQVKEEAKLNLPPTPIAALCGLVLRRLQDKVGVQGETTADQTNVTVADLSAIFGEALEQFSREGE